MTRTMRAVRLGLAVVALCWTSVPARAASDDQPWILDANNWQEGQDLLPEPVVKRLKDGQYWFKVVPVDPAKFKDNYSKKFWDDTAANAGKYDVEPKQCGLVDKATGKIPDFVVGLPFPTITKDEPNAACCYARSDKHWATDPQGIRWEGFHSRGLLEDEVQPPVNQQTGATCCGPTATPVEIKANASARCCG